MIGMYAFAYPNMIVEHYTAERGLPNKDVYKRQRLVSVISVQQPIISGDW